MGLSPLGTSSIGGAGNITLTSTISGAYTPDQGRHGYADPDRLQHVCQWHDRQRRHTTGRRRVRREQRPVDDQRRRGRRAPGHRVDCHGQQRGLVEPDQRRSVSGPDRPQRRHEPEHRRDDGGLDGPRESGADRHRDRRRHDNPNSAGLPDAATIRNQIIQGISGSFTASVGGAGRPWFGTALAGSPVGREPRGGLLRERRRRLTVTVAAVIPGDANLDGVVDNRDRNTSWPICSTPHEQRRGARWQDGDFNYNGVVDTLDRGIFLANQGTIKAAGAVAP